MAQMIHPGRFTADLGDRDEIVVFVIGMRINRFWQFWRWLPVFAAMPKMIEELCRDPSLGLLARPSTFMSGRVFLLVQYWRSFEDLERFARAPKGSHLEAWRNFNRRIRDNGSVGIYHETVLLSDATVETVYGNMPAFGLAAVTGAVPAKHRGQSARTRLTGAENDLPVDSY